MSAKAANIRPPHLGPPNARPPAPPRPKYTRDGDIPPRRGESAQPLGPIGRELYGDDEERDHNGICFARGDTECRQCGYPIGPPNRIIHDPKIPFGVIGWVLFFSLGALVWSAQ